MSYHIPEGSQLLAPSVKMSAGGGGSSTLLPNALQATDLSFYLPGSYGTAGHGLVGDGLGNFSFVDLVDQYANDVFVATDAVASNGNLTMGLQAGLRQKLFGNGNYSVKTNDQSILSYDAATNQFDFGNVSYYTKNDCYTVQSQTILGAIAAANAWRVTNSTKTSDYLNLDVTAGSEKFVVGSSSTPVTHTTYTLSDQTILGAAAATHAWSVKNSSTYFLDLDVTAGSTGFVFGQASASLGKILSYTLQDQVVLGSGAVAHAWSVKNSADYYLDLDATSGSEALQVGSSTLPVKTTVYGNLVSLTAANSKPPRLGLGSGTEVLRVGGNLQSLPTIPVDFVITNAAETSMMSETVNANFLNDAGTQVRVKFAVRDVIIANNCQFKFRLKFGTTLLLDSPVYTSFNGGFTMGEFVMQIVTNGANPTRNVTVTWMGARQSNTFQQSALRNFVGAVDFTTSQALQLMVVGTANSNDTQQLEQASMDVVLPEITSP